jgi:predicted metalloprotease with PDZ domain
MELYYVDGKILLGDVAKGSPAEAAGLKEGDEVIALNNNFTQNFNNYKYIIQSTTGKLKIIVMRNGELQQYEIKMKTIIQKKKLRLRRQKDITRQPG